MIGARVLWIVALVAAGCGDGAARPDAGRGAGLTGRSHVGGAVVATVDGVAITRDDVVRASRETGLAPRAALDRLIEQELLASEAQRRGLARAPSVTRATEQALAQALLAREVEDRVRPESVTDVELAAAYQAARSRFDVPERRTSVHVLARLGADAAPEVVVAGRRFADRALADFAIDSDPEAWLLRNQGVTGRRFEVRAEHVPPLGQGDAADPAYIAALATIPGRGPLPAPVRSSFGWHAIVVTDVTPAHSTPQAEAFAVLRTEIVTRRRAERLDALLRELTERTTITRDPAVIRAAFARELGDERSKAP